VTISAKVIADTQYRGSRLTTLELVYPRFIHSEFMTHRVFSRNAASSRAIPIKKMLEAVRNETAMPISWGKNQKGMSAAEELSPQSQKAAEMAWLDASKDAAEHAEHMESFGVHKQIANRLLEPYMHMQTLVSSTEWANFFHLRTAAGAQPEFQALAEAMLAAMNASTPVFAQYGYWHLPYLSEFECHKLDHEDQLKVCVARCARISYTKHGQVRDLEEDRARHDDMATQGHWSPFEHAAIADHLALGANFRNFVQYRQYFPQECVQTFDRLIVHKEPDHG
jgi:thymidylate synthase ThyX